MRATRASCLGARNGSTPLASRSSTVPPSLPGAPFLAVATREASRSVSLVPTWTSRPQNRQAGAACAFPSLLRCRSCRLLGACVLSPLPPMPPQSATQQGPCAPQACPRFPAPTDPSAPLASSVACPGDRFDNLPGFRRCRGGPRRASPGASRGRVARLSRPPRRSGPPRPPDCADPYGLHLHGCRLGLRGCSLAGPPVRSLALRPGDSPPSHVWGCREASEGWCPVPLLSELHGSGFSPGRFASSCTRQPSLDAQPDVILIASSGSLVSLSL